MHLDALPNTAADLPAKVLSDLDAALETIRFLGTETVASDQIELARMARHYFEIRAREIEHAAMARREDPFGLQAAAPLDQDRRPDDDVAERETDCVTEARFFISLAVRDLRQAVQGAIRNGGPIEQLFDLEQCAQMFGSRDPQANKIAAWIVGDELGLLSGEQRETLLGWLAEESLTLDDVDPTHSNEGGAA